MKMSTFSALTHLCWWLCTHYWGGNSSDLNGPILPSPNLPCRWRASAFYDALVSNGDAWWSSDFSVLENWIPERLLNKSKVPIRPLPLSLVNPAAAFIPSCSSTLLRPPWPGHHSQTILALSSADRLLSTIPKPFTSNTHLHPANRTWLPRHFFKLVFV